MGRPRRERMRSYEKLGGTENGTLNTSAISLQDIVIILTPFFWPDNSLSKLRSISTWLLVILSKLCTLLAPLYLSAATNMIANGHYTNAVWNVAIFAALKFFSGNNPNIRYLKYQMNFFQ